MNQHADHPSPPQHWVDSLLHAKAQIAAGEIVDMAPVLVRLRESAERLERRQAKADQKV